MFWLKKAHEDWYHDGLDNGEDLWRLDFSVPEYPWGLQAQLFATPSDFTDDKKANQVKEFNINYNPVCFKEARLFLERDRRQAANNHIRVDYACACWPLTDSEARSLLTTSMGGVVSKLSEKIAHVLSLPCQPEYLDKKHDF